MGERVLLLFPLSNHWISMCLLSGGSITFLFLLSCLSCSWISTSLLSSSCIASLPSCQDRDGLDDGLLHHAIASCLWHLHSVAEFVHARQWWKMLPDDVVRVACQYVVGTSLRLFACNAPNEDEHHIFTSKQIWIKCHNNSDSHVQNIVLKKRKKGSCYLPACCT